jgi:hypothetical protein
MLFNLLAWDVAAVNDDGTTGNKGIAGSTFAMNARTELVLANTHTAALYQRDGRRKKGHARHGVALATNLRSQLQCQSAFPTAGKPGQHHHHQLVAAHRSMKKTAARKK